MRIGGIAVGVALSLLLIPAAADASPSPDRSGPSRHGAGTAQHGPRPQARPMPQHAHGPYRGRGGVQIHVGGGWRYGGWNYGVWGPAWSYSPYWAYPAWGPGVYAYPRVYPQPGVRHGALDLDVSPERAEVWVDGTRIGVADEFDGFPNYLWLEQGTYDVVFYLPGRKTLARQYTIYPGLVIDVEDRMEVGESIHPLELKPTSHVNRDERLRRDRELREQVELRERPEDRMQAGDGVGSRSAIDARAEPGRVNVNVEPEDASVYLDGRFLGSGRELSGLRAGLLVDSGRHLLEVVRPGYRAERLEIEVEAGEEESVTLELVPEALN